MRLRKAVFVLLCAVLLGALVPANAMASHYVSKATSADAWYSNWNYENGDPGPGDATVDWNISGSTGRSLFSESGVQLDQWKGSMGWVTLYSYTPASGSTPATWKVLDVMSEQPSFVFSKKLSTASVDFIAEGYESTWVGSEPWVPVGPDEWEMREPDSETSEMISVMGSWKATGAATKSVWTSRESSDGFYWADRNAGTSRAATAEVSVVGAGGTVYIDQTSNDASIGEQKSVGRQRGEFPY